MENKSTDPKGRGSHVDPPNRFGGPNHVPDLEQVEEDADYLASLRDRPTKYVTDSSRSVISENDSPDVGFRYSLNPYRGCTHGCSYCYARPTHEYLGLSAGLDFERIIFVKHAAPALFREFLSKPKYRPEPITLSGVTDPYQPAERDYELTRQCLEIAVEAKQPISLITKNALILRDQDLLSCLAEDQLVHVNISVTTLDAELARSMEPRTSTPAARLRSVEKLNAAGVPVRVLIAPIIPGLNDSELPMILAAAKAAGATAADFVMVRLPWTVAPVFQEWLARTHPTSVSRIEGRIRAVHGGKLNYPEFGSRMSGTGLLAEQICALFRVFARRHQLDGDLPAYDCSKFRPPSSSNGQGWLF